MIPASKLGDFALYANTSLVQTTIHFIVGHLNGRRESLTEYQTQFANVSSIEVHVVTDITQSSACSYLPRAP